MEECLPGIEYASIKDDPSKTDNPPPIGTSSPAGEPEHVEDERSQLLCSHLNTISLILISSAKMKEGPLGYRLRTYRSVPLPQYRTVPLGVVICMALNFTWPVPAFILCQSSSYMHVVLVFNLEIVLQQVHREAIYFVYQLHTSTLHVLNCKTLMSSETEYVQMYNSDIFCDKGNLILSSYVAESIAT